eukprot:gene18440-23559_t
MEWSLQSREIEQSTLIDTARELGVGIVAYSPMDRGLLTNTAKSFEQLSESDWRRKSPRFSPENIAKNLPSQTFLTLAEKRKLTPTQLALSWLHAQGDDVFPIPGTKSLRHLEENANAVWVAQSLTPSELKEIQDCVPPAVGDRYE